MFHTLDMKLLPEDLLIMIYYLFLPLNSSEDSQCATAAKLLRRLLEENFHLYSFDVLIHETFPQPGLMSQMIYHQPSEYL